MPSIASPDPSGRRACRTVRQSGLQGLLQGVQHEIRAHGAPDPPAHDAPREDVNHKDHIQPALPGRDAGEIADPQRVRPLGTELPIDPTQAQAAHEPLDRAASHRQTLPAHLLPDLVCAIDLQGGVPDPLDARDQGFIALDAGTASVGHALQRSMAPVARRGNLQDFAD